MKLMQDRANSPVCRETQVLHKEKRVPGECKKELKHAKVRVKSTVY